MELAVTIEHLRTDKPEFGVPKSNVDKTEGPNKGKFDANVNVSTENSWRMVYDLDEQKVYALFESEGFTYTVLSLFVATTRQECVDKAASLGLAD